MNLETLLNRLSEVRIPLKGQFPDNLPEGSLHYFPLQINNRPIRVGIDVEVVSEVRESIYGHTQLCVRPSSSDVFSLKEFPGWFTWPNCYFTNMPDEYTVTPILREEQDVWFVKLPITKQGKQMFDCNTKLNLIRPGDKLKITFTPKIYLNTEAKKVGFFLTILTIKKDMKKEKKKKDDESV